MNKLLIFLVLLLVPLRSAGKDLPETYDILNELESWDMDFEEEDEFDLFEWPSWESSRASKNLVNVEAFGAVGDGVSDDTQAFKNAWNEACSTARSVLLVPSGRSYLVKATRFNGPCVDKLVVQIEGTIVAPELKDWDPNSPRTWIVFNNLTNVFLQGNGVIDGNGHKWWEASCKKNKANPCQDAPAALTIDSSSRVRVKGLQIQNGQQMNFIIARSNLVRVFGMKVTAPGDSPNTDGIHITGSTNVVLQNCKVGTGDDCVSIVSGTSNVRLKNMQCGPGHGISIGSLGKNNSTGTVENVVVDRAVIRGASNGVRIKTWQGGSGYVKAVRFQNIVMEDVANPIIIDQFYCDSPTSCKPQDSAVAISQIMYLNITGTSKTKNAMKFACSDTVPCKEIILKDINLQGNNDDVTSVVTFCHSAAGIIKGDINPDAQCLLSASNKDQKVEGDDIIIHTEL
ncbi:Pectin lyase-like superfamily protein [Striga hermonthica]|uniref:endo-polygalacturonase n=1 Tax=Striga hermonthica TaxID=68872 RepID=A0A9N7NY63_STRHE|nr:Pectin lyase-like superfamily protein [Striga hermonthica]